MDLDEQTEAPGRVEARWPIDLEAAVAKRVRRLREAHGVSQQQLGADLSRNGFGMHQVTVAQLEAGAKPLRLNEVAAIAAYFDVPVESLWQEGSGTLSGIGDHRPGFSQSAEVEQMAADYYRLQRIERLRDK
jgi:transcriptional regulator with XRE-family HTH domain